MDWCPIDTDWWLADVLSSQLLSVAGTLAPGGGGGVQTP